MEERRPADRTLYRCSSFVLGRFVLEPDAPRWVRTNITDHAAAYNVTHYLWFTLRDTDSTALGFEQRYGLLEDTYEPKPAFHRYRALVSELG